MAKSTDPIVDFTDNNNGTTTVKHRSGIVRTLTNDHPAVMFVTAGLPDEWAHGTGRGFPRNDVIHHGHVTKAGNAKSYVCEACGERMPATKFPTYHKPRSDGRTRNTTECRGCRDARYEAARVPVADVIESEALEHAKSAG